MGMVLEKKNKGLKNEEVVFIGYLIFSRSKTIQTVSSSDS